MNTIKKLLLTTGAVVAAILLLAPAAAAKTQFLTNFSSRQYLETRRTIHSVNGYFKDTKVTIPKGTIFYCGKPGVSKGNHPFVQIHLPDLSWPIRKQLIESKHGSYDTAGIWATTANFKKVKRPAYLAYSPAGYGAADAVWKGNKALPLASKEKQDCFWVTDDGYLEFDANASIYSLSYQKPQDYAKVQRFIKKGANTYFYTKTAVSGLPMTKVTGNKQYHYRLKMTKTNHYLATINPSVNKKYDDYATISNRYNVSGQRFYMTDDAV